MNGRIIVSALLILLEVLVCTKQIQGKLKITRNHLYYTCMAHVLLLVQKIICIAVGSLRVAFHIFVISFSFSCLY